jgi:hypothetical protein
MSRIFSTNNASEEESINEMSKQPTFKFIDDEVPINIQINLNLCQLNLFHEIIIAHVSMLVSAQISLENNVTEYVT